MKLVRAFLYGVRDGWQQPKYLNSSRNVDHLIPEGESGYGKRGVYEWLDKGINIGQLIRAGWKSEAWEQKFWPFKWMEKK